MTIMTVDGAVIVFIASVVLWTLYYAFVGCMKSRSEDFVVTSKIPPTIQHGEIIIRAPAMVAHGSRVIILREERPDGEGIPLEKEEKEAEEEEMEREEDDDGEGDDTSDGGEVLESD